MLTGSAICCHWCHTSLGNASEITYLNGNLPVCGLCLVRAQGPVDPDPMADFVTVKANKKDYERLVAEVKRLKHDLANAQVAAEFVRELKKELDRNKVERDRYKAALESQMELVNSNIITTWPDIAGRLITIAREALAEAVRP